MQGLVQLADKYPIIDVRGRGLMCAVEFGGHDGSMTASPGVAAAVTKAAGKRNMLLLTAGTLLFTPTLFPGLHAHPTSWRRPRDPSPTCWGSCGMLDMSAGSSMAL